MSDAHNKKVLIITYYWPPAGGPGVQRWLKFVKYLPKYHIDPIVYVPENPKYPIIDQSLKQEIPEGITILKRPISEPYKIASLFSKSKSDTLSKGVIPTEGKQTILHKMLLFIRGNFFIPDARKAWVDPSVDFLVKYLDDHKISTIITSGPPHSLHLIGLKLKAAMTLKWIADFRDPWTTIGYHKKLKLTAASKRRHKQLELQVLTCADTIIVTSKPTKEEFESKTDTPVELITNGFDPIEMDSPEKDLIFSISHIGSLLSGRNPAALWKALSELVAENADFRDAFKLRLAGIVSQDIKDSLKRYGLETYTEYLGYISHQEAIKLQMSSQLLLLIEIDSQDTAAIIPGKIFEYMYSKTPILAIGPKNSDIPRLLSQTNTGDFFTYEQYHEIKVQLWTYFEKFKNGSTSRGSINIEAFSREHLTKKLSELI